jgi:hypothetical protein
MSAIKTKERYLEFLLIDAPSLKNHVSRIRFHWYINNAATSHLQYSFITTRALQAQTLYIKKLILNLQVWQISGLHE